MRGQSTATPVLGTADRRRARFMTLKFSTRLLDYPWLTGAYLDVSKPTAVISRHPKVQCSYSPGSGIADSKFYFVPFGPSWHRETSRNPRLVNVPQVSRKERSEGK